MSNENGKVSLIAKTAGLKRYLGAICYKHPEMNGERNAKNRGCIGCNKEKMRKRRAENPEYHRAAMRASYLKNKEKYQESGIIRARLKRTGIDASMYKRLLEIQEGKCPVCQCELAVNRPHADHCHDTKRPRGILCSSCNQAEGMVRRRGMRADEFGRRLAEYLLNPPARKLEQ